MYVVLFSEIQIGHCNEDLHSCNVALLSRSSTVSICVKVWLVFSWGLHNCCNNYCSIVSCAEISPLKAVISQSVMSTDTLDLPSNPTAALRTVLKWIADSLSAEDVKAIAYIYNLPCTAGQRTAFGVLGELEKRGTFSHNNVEPLIRLLSDINRHDIIKNAWMEDFKRQCAGELLVVQEVSQLVLHVATENVYR